MNLEKVRKGYALLKEGMEVLGGGPLDYYLMRLADCYELLLTYAPFQVGTSVMLNRTPVIDEHTNWGWYGFRHLFLQHKRATVVEIEADKDGFRYQITFDEQPEDKFLVRQAWLSPVPRD